jgi:hypothetical protein
MFGTAEIDPVEVFAEANQVSLIGLSHDDFHGHFADYSLLLVRLEDQVVVAASVTDNRQALEDAVLSRTPLESLAGYAFENGPAVLSAAFEQLACSHREGEVRTTRPRSG